MLETRCLLSSISLVNDVDGYTGTVDTWIDGGRSSRNYGSSNTLEIDGNSGVEQALLRFDGIFGNDVGQIAAGSAIESASLEIYVSDRGHAPNVHRLLTDWSEADTWNSLNDGLQIGSDVVATPEATFSGAKGFVSIDVTSSLQHWANDPTSNMGWAFLPTGTNGVGFSSSENSSVTDRPRLSVTHTPYSLPPANTAPVAQNDSDSTSVNTAVIVRVLDNDSDADDDALTPSIVSHPAHGTARVNANGTITYTPEANFNGSESFTYSVSDGTAPAPQQP
ncbi:MAG: Ig-like domain-containing protein [Fuerstiella sp.]